MLGLGWFRMKERIHTHTHTHTEFCIFRTQAFDGCDPRRGAAHGCIAGGAPAATTGFIAGGPRAGIRRHCVTRTTTWIGRAPWQAER